jgi:hypothetical protein
MNDLKQKAKLNLYAWFSFSELKYFSFNINLKEQIKKIE